MFYRIKNRIRRLLIRPNKVVYDPTDSISESAILRNVKLGRYNRISDQSHLINTEIGDYTYLAGFNSLMNVKIGKFCSIAGGVAIGPGRHPSKTFVSTSPVFFSKYTQLGTSFSNDNYFKDTGFVTIGNDVWIGINAVILDDVSIGDGAIVAAGAVVTGDVQPYSIVGGVPAKLLGYRFSKDQIDFLLKDEWWNKDIEWVKANYKKFHNISDYIEHVTLNAREFN